MHRKKGAVRRGHEKLRQKMDGRTLREMGTTIQERNSREILKLRTFTEGLVRMTQ